MTLPRDPDVLLAAYLDEGMKVLPDRIVGSVLDEIHRTRQRTVIGPWRTRLTARAVVSTAAVVALLVVGAALLSQRGRFDVAAPSPSPGASGSPTQPAIVTVTPSPTPEVLSLDLAWTKVDLDPGLRRVAWLRDRFVMVDDAGAIGTSLDGATWTLLQSGDPDPGYADLLGTYATVVSWDDEIVGWWNPQEGPEVTNKPPITARDILRIVRPPAASFDTSPFKGRIDTIGVGPAGIVAFVGSHIDTDEFIASRLGENWVSHYTGVDFHDGILNVGMDNGPGLHVVWADEGLLPGDLFGAGFGWFSPDGVEWTAMDPYLTPDVDGFRGTVPGGGSVVGVSDGFIVRGVNPEDSCPLPDGCSSLWYSADGLTWRNLGHPEADSSSDYTNELVPWMGGALLTDGSGHFDFWTSEGPSPLPMVADLPAAWIQPDPPLEASYSTGPLGLVTILRDSHEILVTWDGEDSKIGPLPAAMVAAHTGRGAPDVVVGARSVLAVTWSGTYEAGYTSTLWVGIPTP